MVLGRHDKAETKHLIIRSVRNGPASSAKVFDQHLSTAYTSLKVIQTYLELLTQEHLEKKELLNNKGMDSIFYYIILLQHKAIWNKILLELL
jgi:hypothetical protein